MTSSRKDWLVAASLGLLAFVAYAAVAPTGLVGADNGEFVTLRHAPGVAHPPGYPLYVIYLRATTWFPGLSAAHSAALATAVLGAGSIPLLFLALRRWKFPWPAAAATAMLIGIDATVWAVHSHAEVFALNNLIAAAIFWAAAPDSRHGIPRALTLGLLAGLGLANHHSIIFLAPIGLYGIYLAVREYRNALLPIGAAILAGVVGLLPYLYLVGGAGDCVECLSWGRVENFGQLVDHFLRADYGTTQLGIGGERDPYTHWAAFGDKLVTGTFGVIAIAALVGIRAGRKEHVTTFLLFGATFAGCGIVFVGLFNTAPEGIGAHIVSRFYALPVFALAPFVAASFAALRARKTTFIIVAAIGIVLPVVNGAAILASYTGAIDDYVHDIYAGLPEDAVLFGTGDHRTFGSAYYQQVRGQRPDVLYIDGMLLAYDWYVDNLERRTGVELPRTDESGIPIGEVIDAFHETGRPVFATHPFTDVIKNHVSYPLGTNLRLVPRGERPPHPRDLARENSELFSQFELNTPRAQVVSPWEREVYDHYTRTWDSLADALMAIGDAEGARHATTLAETYGADSPEPH